MSGVGRFHHVGVAVREIDAAAEAYADAYGARVESAVIHDPEQGVRLQFLRIGDLRVELLAPAGEPSPVDSFLKRGIGLYHVCHEVDDLEATLAAARLGGAVLVSPPKAAVAFGGRRVAFVMQQGLMVELLEAPEHPPSSGG